MTKFLVISYNTGTQETFFDYVLAEDETAAHEFIAEVRHNAVVVAVYNEREISGVLHSMVHMTPADIERDMRTLKEAYANERRR